MKITKLDLIGCWTDSREENVVSSGMNIYRPCDFKTFPASRYRFKMVLKANDECSWLYLASNNAHYMVDGHWAFDKEKGIIEIFNLKGKSAKKIWIIELSENIMKIKEWTN